MYAVHKVDDKWEYEIDLVCTQRYDRKTTAGLSSSGFAATTI